MQESERTAEALISSGGLTESPLRVESERIKSTRLDADSKQTGQEDDDANPANSISYNHQCYICDKTFSANSNLNRHLRKIHKENVQSPYNNVKCALCESLYSSSSLYIRHLERDHEVEISVEKLKFSSKELFEDWKHSVERATTSQYIKSRGQKQTKNVNKTYYSCNRSGYYVSKARTQKALKKKGSRKINGRCPASMNVTVNPDASYDIKFIKTHVGHDFELKHLDLSEKDRELIVRKLTSGVTKKDIIRQIRSRAEPHADDTLSLLHSSSMPPSSLGLNVNDIQPIVINSRSSVPGISEQMIEVVVPSIESDRTTASASDGSSRSPTRTTKREQHSSDQRTTTVKTRTKNLTTTSSPSTKTSLTPTSRLHLTTTKDIHNILNSKHLDSRKIRHNYDLHAIEAWIIEMKDYDEESTVLFYKDQTELVERFPKLRHDDFMLVLMKNGQAELLKKLGSTCIVIDSTHNIHCEYLHVTYLSVIDEDRRGFPVAYLFSTRTDLDTIEVFYTLLKDRVGPISTRILMADELHEFYQAWWRVMSMPVHNLLTPWSVFDSWTKMFKLIKDKEKLRKIKRQLRKLLSEAETEKFNCCLQQILNDYKRDTDTSEFIEFFEEQFAKNTDVWSNSLRRNYHISNILLWNMHEKFKPIYKEGKNSKKMCKYVTCLMNLFEDAQIEKLIEIEEENLAAKRQIIEKRHKKGIETGSIVYEVAVDPAYWLCPSECSGDVYDEVRQTNDVKDRTILTGKAATSSQVERGRKCCELLCPDCQACRHEYKCTCLDYVVNLNMCKHIHRISALCKQS